jgi:hypothetical protein
MGCRCLEEWPSLYFVTETGTTEPACIPSGRFWTFAIGCGGLVAYAVGGAAGNDRFMQATALRHMPIYFLVAVESNDTFFDGFPYIIQSQLMMLAALSFSFVAHQSTFQYTLNMVVTAFILWLSSNIGGVGQVAEQYADQRQRRNIGLAAMALVSVFVAAPVHLFFSRSRERTGRGPLDSLDSLLPQFHLRTMTRRTGCLVMFVCHLLFVAILWFYGVCNPTPAARALDNALGTVVGRLGVKPHSGVADDHTPLLHPLVLTLHTIVGLPPVPLTWVQLSCIVLVAFFIHSISGLARFLAYRWRNPGGTTGSDSSRGRGVSSGGDSGGGSRGDSEGGDGGSNNNSTSKSSGSDVARSGRRVSPKEAQWQSFVMSHLFSHFFPGVFGFSFAMCMGITWRAMQSGNLQRMVMVCPVCVWTLCMYAFLRKLGVGEDSEGGGQRRWGGGSLIDSLPYSRGAMFARIYVCVALFYNILIVTNDIAGGGANIDDWGPRWSTRYRQKMLCNAKPFGQSIVVAWLTLSFTDRTWEGILLPVVLQVSNFSVVDDGYTPTVFVCLLTLLGVLLKAYIRRHGIRRLFRRTPTALILQSLDYWFPFIYYALWILGLLMFTARYAPTHIESIS